MDKKGKQMSRNSVSPSWFSPEPMQSTGKSLAETTDCTSGSFHPNAAPLAVPVSLQSDVDK